MELHENIDNGLRELSDDELQAVVGGTGIPGYIAPPTWKYFRMETVHGEIGTPDWAIDSAKDAGYEVENVNP